VSRTTRFAMLAIATSLVVALAASADEPKTTPKGRQLPQNWGKIGLSEEQKDKLYTILADFRFKVEELNKQISELKKKERDALETVLTDGQKTRLKEIFLEKAPGAKPESKPESKPETKPAAKTETKPGTKPSK